jgi:hypothetical protein
MENQVKAGQGRKLSVNWLKDDGSAGAVRDGSISWRADPPDAGAFEAQAGNDVVFRAGADKANMSVSITVTGDAGLGSGEILVSAGVTLDIVPGIDRQASGGEIVIGDPVT